MEMEISDHMYQSEYEHPKHPNHRYSTFSLYPNKSPSTSDYLANAFHRKCKDLYSPIYYVIIILFGIIPSFYGNGFLIHTREFYNNWYIINVILLSLFGIIYVVYHECYKNGKGDISSEEFSKFCNYLCIIPILIILCAMGFAFILMGFGYVALYISTIIIIPRAHIWVKWKYENDITGKINDCRMTFARFLTSARYC